MFGWFRKEVKHHGLHGINGIENEAAPFALTETQISEILKSRAEIAKAKTLP